MKKWIVALAIIFSGIAATPLMESSPPVAEAHTGPIFHHIGYWYGYSTHCTNHPVWFSPSRPAVCTTGAVQLRSSSYEPKPCIIFVEIRRGQAERRLNGSVYWRANTDSSGWWVLFYKDYRNC